MSLSRWLKSYLYIPLGGNREASFGTYFWIVLFAIIGAILSGSWAVSLIFLGNLIYHFLLVQFHYLIKHNMHVFVN